VKLSKFIAKLSVNMANLFLLPPTLCLTLSHTRNLTGILIVKTRSLKLWTCSPRLFFLTASFVISHFSNLHTFPNWDLWNKIDESPTKLAHYLPLTTFGAARVKGHANQGNYRSLDLLMTRTIQERALLSFFLYIERVFVFNMKYTFNFLPSVATNFLNKSLKCKEVSLTLTLHWRKQALLP